MADTDRKRRIGEGGSPSRKRRRSTSDGHTDYEEGCVQCEKIVLETEYAGPVLTMHVDIKAICPSKGEKGRKKKDEERDKKEKEKLRILKKICALRNTLGGCLIIYFENMDYSDKFLGDFDEMLDDRLQELIEDGTLFSDSYLRKWHQIYKHCLCITCNPSPAISTLDYKAHMSLDKGFGRFTALNIRYLLASDKQTLTYAKIPLDKVQEQSNIQLKSFRDSTSLPFVEWPKHIMNKLRLREYIAAFANQKSGGYFFLGIAEKEYESQNYHRKRVVLEGFQVSKKQQKDLKEALMDLVKKDMFWVDRDMEEYHIKTIENSIKFTFRETERESFSVLEVFVYPLQGIVFHDRSGPLSFQMREDQLAPIDAKNWLANILKIKMPS